MTKMFPANYSDFKKVLAALQIHGVVFFWGGSGSSDWGCIFISFDAKVVIQSIGVSNPTPPPSFIQPSTFTTDFPNAVNIDGAPSFIV